MRVSPACPADVQAQIRRNASVRRAARPYPQELGHFSMQRIAYSVGPD
jgi:hypothetical protein